MAASEVAEPGVTVVIPTHARDAFLEEAIASVVAQCAPPAALVVSDDTGSPDTRAVVERWAAIAPFAVRYLDSSGPGAGTAGASRNAGAALATTDVLAFLDDDDTWHPDFLSETVAVLEREDADFAVAWTVADEGGYLIARLRPGLTATNAVARNPGFVGSNFVMRRERFRSLEGFDATLPVSNDKDLLVRALQAGLRYAVVERELVCNRIHREGQLTDKSPRRVEGIRRYMAKHDSLLSPHDRRSLRAQLASVQRVSAPGRALRWGYTAQLVWYRVLLAAQSRR
ncbi:MAG: glycosyltransferase family 2 protein [Actinomycetales bacterium]|nr:glycosyltransferase family 2 protein [Actinomycetales bacterium]